MSRTRSFIDRLVLFLLGAALLFPAVWGAGHLMHWAWADQLSGKIHVQSLAGADGRADYIPWLIGLAALLGVLGILLLLMNVENRRIGKQVTKESTSDGVLQAYPADLASAVAQELTRQPGVRMGSHKAIEDRGRQFLEVTLRVDPKVDLVTLRQNCEQAAADCAEAFPSSAMVPRFMINVDKTS